MFRCNQRPDARKSSVPIRWERRDGTNMGGAPAVDMPALLDYCVGMKSRRVQYTIRGIPSEVDQALKRKARRAQKSVNELAVAALRREAGVGEEPRRHHDLDALAGTWENDPLAEEALAAQRKVDLELWR